MTWSAGTFSRTGGSTAWGDDRDAATEIEAGLHDTHDEDLAQGINDCLHKGGQNAATADISMGSNKLTNLAAPTADNDAATKAYADGAAPSGMVVPFAGASAPSGYLLCDASAVSRTTYAELFAVIGTTYGAGDGSTTFNVPDLRGRTVAGKGSGTRLTTALNDGTLGAAGGSQSHTLTASEAAQKNLGNLSVGGLTASGGSLNVPGGGFGGFNSDVTISGQNASSAHNNTQPTIILNYLIKT